MNNTFNIQRFGLLLKRKWLEFGKIYLITLAVALGVMLISYSVAFWDLFSNPIQISERSTFFRGPLFLGFGFLFITVMASAYFSHLGQKSKTIIDLLIPASTFEKFLAGVLFTGILSTLSFILLFCLTDLVFVARLRSAYLSMSASLSPAEASSAVKAATEHLTYFIVDERSRFGAFFYISSLFTSSIFLLGSVYFDRFHYIKTALSVMVFVGIWAFLVFKSGEFFMHNKHMSGHPAFFNNPDKDVMTWLAYVLLLTLTLIFWVVTYVRLKEKEV